MAKKRNRRTPKGGAWHRTFDDCWWEKDPRKAELSFYSAKHTLAKRLLQGYYGYRASLYDVAGVLGITHKVAEEHYAPWSDECNASLWQAIGNRRRGTAAG
jgi:hypothetical protein